MKLLIVDDDQDMLNLIRVFLKHRDYEIMESKNGNDAFTIAIEQEPDIAIIDGLIPGIHGFELCKKIKEEPSLIRTPRIIIMSSVYKGSKYKFELMEQYHADDYIAKPFRKEELLAKIDCILQDKT